MSLPSRVSAVVLLALAQATAVEVVAGQVPGASWIELCPDGPSHKGQTPALDREYLRIDGTSHWLTLSDAPSADCESRRLPIDRDHVRWFGLIPEQKASRLPRGVILQGIEAADQIQISEVVVAESAVSRPSALPLNTNLFKRLNPRPYGIEERATFTPSNNSLELICKPGKHPAGIVLRNDQARLPGAIAPTLDLRYRSDAPFSVGYADGVNFALEMPFQLERLRVPSAKSSEPIATSLAMPALTNPNSHNTDQPGFAVTVMCPGSGGSIRISSLKLGARSQTRRPDRSVWIWRPVEWLEQPETLLAELLAMATPVAYVSVPIDSTVHEVSNPSALARFIGAATARNIEVWAVEGDPHAVLPAGQAAFLKRAAALNAFNAAQPPDQQLRGVQYDIEPYLLADFALHQNDWLKAYIRTIKSLSDMLVIPLEVAVPFWWSGLEADDELLLDQLSPHVQSLNVMNYRTDPELLQEFAEPFLSWGAEQGVGIRIALEAGPILDEDRWHYQPSDAGTLWHIELGEHHLLMLLNTRATPMDGSAFRLARQSQFSGNRLTFKGERERMDRVMQILETTWRAWPSFAGLALHEYRLEKDLH